MPDHLYKYDMVGNTGSSTLCELLITSIITWFGPRKVFPSRGSRSLLVLSMHFQFLFNNSGGKNALLVGNICCYYMQFEFVM